MLLLTLTAYTFEDLRWIRLYFGWVVLLVLMLLHAGWQAWQLRQHTAQADAAQLRAQQLEGDFERAKGSFRAPQLDPSLPLQLAKQEAANQQLQRLVPKHFLTAAPWPQLAHFARYLKAITARLDKLRADPARDAAKLAELRPHEQRYWRLVAERKGQVDARMQEMRWLLEELRVSFFAQELRTPQPVSTKRLDKLWAQIQS